MTADETLRRVRPNAIEHWLALPDDSDTTCLLEHEWTLHNLDYLRKREHTPAS